MSVLNRDKKFNIDMIHREEVLTKIAQQLQDKFGYGKPSIYEYREYERNRSFLIERTKALKHFGEKDFPGSEKILLMDIKVENVVPSTFDDVSSDEEGDSKNYLKYQEKKKPRDARFGDATRLVKKWVVL